MQTILITASPSPPEILSVSFVTCAFFPSSPSSIILLWCCSPFFFFFFFFLFFFCKFHLFLFNLYNRDIQLTISRTINYYHLQNIIPPPLKNFHRLIPYRCLLLSPSPSLSLGLLFLFLFSSRCCILLLLLFFFFLFPFVIFLTRVQSTIIVTYYS